MTTDSNTARERPILFTGAMVRAILSGQKTMTRRVIKPQPEVLIARGSEGVQARLEAIWQGIRHSGAGGRAVTLANLWESWAADRCPYGVSALYRATPDRLWARETWAAASEYDRLPPSEIPEAGRSRLHYLADGPKPEWAGKTRASIHMPRWASRLALELCAVRVEQLQEISCDDACSEGVEDLWETCTTCRGSGTHPYGDVCSCDGGGHYVHSALVEFQRLWDSINGKTCPWESNPFVWVVSFRRLEGGAK